MQNNPNLRIDKITTLVNGCHVGLETVAEGTTVGEVLSAVATVFGQLIDVVISAQAGEDRERNIAIARGTLQNLLAKTAVESTSGSRWPGVM